MHIPAAAEDEAPREGGAPDVVGDVGVAHARAQDGAAEQGRRRRVGRVALAKGRPRSQLHHRLGGARADAVAAHAARERAHAARPPVAALALARQPVAARRRVRLGLAVAEQKAARQAPTAAGRALGAEGGRRVGEARALRRGRLLEDVPHVAPHAILDARAAAARCLPRARSLLARGELLLPRKAHAGEVEPFRELRCASPPTLVAHAVHAQLADELGADADAEAQAKGGEGEAHGCRRWRRRGRCLLLGVCVA